MRYIPFLGVTATMHTARSPPHPVTLKITNSRAIIFCCIECVADFTGMQSAHYLSTLLCTHSLSWHGQAIHHCQLP